MQATTGLNRAASTVRRRAIYLKSFLILVATMLALCALNQTLLLQFGSAELKRNFAERQLQQSLQWNGRDALQPDLDKLKLELLQTMRSAHPDEVMVFTVSLDDKAALPLPPGFEQASVTPGPAGTHFPLIADATIELDGKRWHAMRLIAPDSIIVSLINQKASERGVEEFIELRQQTIWRTMPLTMLLVLGFAVLLSRHLPVGGRIQEPLRRPD